MRVQTERERAIGVLAEGEGHVQGTIPGIPLILGQIEPLTVVLGHATLVHGRPPLFPAVP